MYHVCAPKTQTAVIAYFSGLFTILKVSEDEGWENMQNTFEKKKLLTIMLDGVQPYTIENNSCYQRLFWL